MFKRPKAVVFDIDNTLLDSRAAPLFRGPQDVGRFNRWAMTGQAPVNPRVKQFYDNVKKKGYETFFLTARGVDDDGWTPAIAHNTNDNLRQVGIEPSSIAFKPDGVSPGVWKAQQRAELAKKYDIVANVGDSASDFQGGHYRHKVLIKSPHMPAKKPPVPGQLRLRFSGAAIAGKHEPVIEGLRHGGVSGKLRRFLTHFGSGWQGIKSWLGTEVAPGVNRYAGLGMAVSAGVGAFAWSKVRFTRHNQDNPESRGTFAHYFRQAEVPLQGVEAGLMVYAGMKTYAEVTKLMDAGKAVGALRLYAGHLRHEAGHAAIGLGVATAYAGLRWAAAGRKRVEDKEHPLLKGAAKVGAFAGAALAYDYVSGRHDPLIQRIRQGGWAAELERTRAVMKQGATHSGSMAGKVSQVAARVMHGLV